MWIAIFDFEHEKETLQSNPELYKYGPRQLHLNFKLYARDSIYAFAEAALILYFSIFVINYNTPN